MASVTCSRSTDFSDIPNKMITKYYSQRASAGLIITEARQISPQGKGFARTQGIYSKEQIEGWKLVTQEVHYSGGKIFLQLQSLPVLVLINYNQLALLILQLKI